MTLKTAEQKKDRAIQHLTGECGLNLQPNDILHVFLRHVSRSGLRRVYDVYLGRGGDLYRITNSVADLCGFRYDNKHQGISFDGFGYCAAAEIAYHMGALLFPNTNRANGMLYRSHT